MTCDYYPGSNINTPFVSLSLYHQLNEKSVMYNNYYYIDRATELERYTEQNRRTLLFLFLNVFGNDHFTFSCNF